jgi:hypothetical protein
MNFIGRLRKVKKYSFAWCRRLFFHEIIPAIVTVGFLVGYVYCINNVPIA